ncbi:MAG TPA: DUF2239 family protein [Oscillatoriaceae cyanobacterium]
MDSRLDALLERTHTYTAFADHRRHLCTSDQLETVLARAQKAIADGTAAVVIFDDATGIRTEVESNGSAEAILGRLEPAGTEARRLGPGRPKLGVVSREVSLLPRHWDWLAAQPGGASAALRRLVDDARKRHRAQDALRAAREAANKAMSVLAGDQPGFEEVLRALYRDEFARAEALMAAWPEDLRRHFARLTGIAAELAALAQQEAALGSSDAEATPTVGSER